MATITISKKLIPHDDLVIISRHEYEKFLLIAKKKGYTQLDREIGEAIQEYRAGKYFGPFVTAKESIAFLESHRKK